MNWVEMRTQRQHYCAVHNADCPIHGNESAQVLDVAPMLVPGAWICPQAVIEIGEHVSEAEEVLDQNDPPLGIVLDSHEESQLAKAVGYAHTTEARKLEHKIQRDGVESLRRSEVSDAVDFALDGTDQNPDEELNKVLSQMVEAWEDSHET